MWGPCINFCILADTLASVLSRWALRCAWHRGRTATGTAPRARARRVARDWPSMLTWHLGIWLLASGPNKPTT